MIENCTSGSELGPYPYLTNLGAAPLDLYDLGDPTQPTWFTVRATIQDHRNGERPPVSFPPAVLRTTRYQDTDTDRGRSEP